MPRRKRFTGVQFQYSQTEAGSPSGQQSEAGPSSSARQTEAGPSSSAAQSASTPSSSAQHDPPTDHPDDADELHIQGNLKNFNSFQCMDN
jgi:hypothetical protein